MESTEDPALLKSWIPLMMEGREAGETIAATKMDLGTDVNFGSLTRDLITNLANKDNISIS